MRIAVFGPFDARGTLPGLAEGLEAQPGVEVVRLDSRSLARPGARWSPKEYSSVLAATAGCDTVLLMKGMFVHLKDLDVLAAQRDLTYVTFDTITCGPPGREKLQGERAARCRRAIATGAEAVRYLRQRGLQTAQIFQGHRPEVWYPDSDLEAADRQSEHLLFVGSTYAGDAGRRRKLDALTRAGLPLRTLGPDARGGGGVYLHACAAEFYRAQLVLNFVPQQSPGSFSNRVVRALASGACVLSEECDDLVAAAAPVFTFQTDAELVQLAQALAHPNSAEARVRMRTLGVEWAAERTWEKQAAKYVEFLRPPLPPTDGAA